MSRAELIYPLKENIERQIAKVATDRHNKEILMRYYKVRSSEVSQATLLADLIRLNQMSVMLGKKFEDATIQDIEDLIFAVDQRKNSNSTKNKFRQALKSLFRWLKKTGPGDYPPEVRWIRRKKVPLVAIRPEDMISFDDCLRISECASNLRDKALYQCKLDAGCRIGEILTVRVGEVQFNEWGAVLSSDGKTGEAPLILTWSAKTLAIWMNSHPFRDNPQAPLWPLLERNTPQQLTYAAAYSGFRKCVVKAGIKKRVWPHLFKHVSCSRDSELGLPDSYRKYKHHWTPNSKMPQVYEHLSDSIITKIQRESLQKETGQAIALPPEQEKVPILKKCRRCEFDNPRDSLYCNRCTFPLKESEAMEMSMQRSGLETILKKIREDPVKMEKILSLIL